MCGAVLQTPNGPFARGARVLWTLPRLWSVAPSGVAPHDILAPNDAVHYPTLGTSLLEALKFA